VESIAERLKKRIAAAAQSEDATKRANDLLVNRIDRWTDRAKRAAEMSKTLVYERTGEGDKYLPLIISPENAKASVGGSLEAPFIIANSMREVQPEINLLVSPHAGARCRGGLVSTEESTPWTCAPTTPSAMLPTLAAKGVKHNFAKVGSSRPSSLIHTYGPGALLDLPHFTVLPLGLDDWEPVWKRRDRQSEAACSHHACSRRCGRGWAGRSRRSGPTRVRRTSRRTPATARTSGCRPSCSPSGSAAPDATSSGPLTRFEYVNQHPYRPDEAHFEHARCPGRARTGAGVRAASPAKTKRKNPDAVPARYLLVCLDGHLDEFPYSHWVHGSTPCTENPPLRMVDHTGGKGASAAIECSACGARRRMNEAQGQAGRAKLPKCRGRHPHLDGYEPDGCGRETRLMLVGASNLWFSASASVIVMPVAGAERDAAAADALAAALGREMLEDYADRPASPANRGQAVASGRRSISMTSAMTNCARRPRTAGAGA
jgi:hypothetical protein